MKCSHVREEERHFICMVGMRDYFSRMGAFFFFSSAVLFLLHWLNEGSVRDPKSLSFQCKIERKIETKVVCVAGKNEKQH